MPKKLIYGHGINDSDVPIVKQEKINDKWVQVWRCPIYTTWRNILERCYSDKFLEKYPTYKGTTIDQQWLLFSNFKNWVITQNYQNRDIDKDLLLKNNKHYSKETCLFVPHEINTFILNSEKTRGEYALGVSYRSEKSKPYYSHISGRFSGKRKLHLGVFDNEYDAHYAWQNKKIEICSFYIDKYSDEPLIVQVLENYKNSICDDINNNRYTI